VWAAPTGTEEKRLIWWVLNALTPETALDALLLGAAARLQAERRRAHRTAAHRHRPHLRRGQSDHRAAAADPRPRAAREALHLHARRPGADARAADGRGHAQPELGGPVLKKLFIAALVCALA